MDAEHFIRPFNRPRRDVVSPMTDPGHRLSHFQLGGVFILAAHQSGLVDLMTCQPCQKRQTIHLGGCGRGPGGSVDHADRAVLRSISGRYHRPGVEPHAIARNQSIVLKPGIEHRVLDDHRRSCRLADHVGAEGFIPRRLIRAVAPV